MQVALALLLFFNYCICANSVQVECGYSSCTKTNSSLINVHIVPHTHDDVGWLKTVQQYFWGTRNDITHISVKNIIDSVISELEKDETKRFMYVETAFFWLWWKQATPKSRDLFKKLVEEGRLEMVSGGWSMNDEACVHYQSTIDQMTWGHRRLLDTLGKCAIPRIGWQIDPFGHSREQALINTQMSFDALFFARAHHLDRSKRRKEHRMEFIWRTSDDLSGSDLFTGILSDDYGPPTGFNFDILSGESNVVDDPTSEEYNIDRLGETMIQDAQERSELFGQSNIMLTFGNDFNYQDARVNFENIDKIISYVNARQRDGSNVNIFYSTPSCYVYNVNLEGKKYSSKSDDFFPYASDPHSFWAGYFTSRPAFKLLEKQSNALLQSCKSLQVMADLTTNKDDESVAELKEAMGIAQHHDAVSGTEKEQVARDYSLQLNKGRLKCLPLIEKSINKLLPHKGPYAIQHCPLLNVSSCPITEGDDHDTFSVFVHNPLGWHRNDHLIRLPWASDGARITHDGKELEFDLIPIPPHVLSLPEREDSKATHELVFKLDVPATSLVAAVVDRKSSYTRPSTHTLFQISSKGLLIKSKSYGVYFDPTGSLLYVKLQDGSKMKLKQDFLYYKSMSGDNTVFGKRASGAYIFRPNGSALSIEDSSPIRATVIKGKFYTEVRKMINPWISQNIRVSSSDDFIVVDYLVGPIDISDGVGKEIISRFSTDLNTNGTFYTDSNGRQLMKRVRNNWVTFDYEKNEPVAGNYYPVNSRVIIKDSQKNIQMTIFTDRNQGTSSLEDGQVELMVHRRTLCDDAFGVGEALNEPGYDGKGLVIRGTHHILISSIEGSASHRQLGVRMHLPPSLYFAPSTQANSAEPVSDAPEQASMISESLPASVNLLTLENWRNGETLVRLEHIHQRSDPSPSRDTVTVDLAQLFQSRKIEKIIELTLSANQLQSEMSRLEWKFSSDSKGSFYANLSPVKPTNISLDPMQIRTLLIKFSES